MVRSTRSSYACARCYKRKKKCDRRFPSCSQCTRARAQCQGLDRGSEAEVPRSLVSYLEDAVAQLELERDSINVSREMVNPGLDGDSMISPLASGPASSFDAVAAYTAAIRAAQDSAPAVSLSRDNRLPLPYYRAFFLGAELPFPLAFQERRPVNVPVGHDETAVVQLPAEVSDQLMTVYIDRILPQYPLFLKQEVHDMFQRFKTGPATAQSVTPDEQFIIFMIMAVATMTSKARDYRKLVSVAESLRRDAFARLDLSLSCTKPTTTTIQQLLLLAQYGFLLPNSTNLWQVVGDATRIALELGLHLDTPEESGLTDSARDSRRRLYWTLYAMERSVAITSHRPFAVAGDQVHISVPLPQNDPGFPDQRQTLDEIQSRDATTEPHVQFSDNIRFLRLQSEICSVNIGLRPMPNAHYSHQNWLADIERRIAEINPCSSAAKRCVLMECHTLLILHMPCARNPDPEDSSVVKYFDAAVRTAKGYWELIESNDLDNPWHATHHCYEAGILILYGLCHHRAIIQKHYSMARVFEVVHQVSGLFILLVKQWPAAHQCGILFDRLRKWALTYFREDGPSDNSPSLETRQLKDLVFRENADLLYAREQPSASIGQSTFESMFPDFEIDPLSLADSADLLGFFNLFGAGDLQDFGPGLVEDETAQPTLLEAADAAQPPSFATASLSPSGGVNQDQLRVAMEKLPVCSQCKKRRVKCDTDLPACRNCKRLRRDCSYWDTALGEEVTRKHVHALAQHATSLISETQMPSLLLDSASVASSLRPSRALSGERSHERLSSNILCLLPSGSEESLNLIHFGATSSFGRIASQASSSATFFDGDVVKSSPPNPLESLCSSFILDVAAEVSRAEAERLVWLYYRSVEITYPTLGRDLIRDTLNQIYGESSVAKDDEDATRTRFYFMLAISLALLGNQDSRLELAADAYFRKAISLGSSSDQFIHPNRQSLQMMLLLCVYAWIRPSAMDIWRLLGHASRMCLDIIEVHGSGRMDPADSGVPYRTIYTLETQVAISLGRPSQLPNGQDIPVDGAVSSSSTAGDLPTMVYNLARLESRFHRFMVGNSSAQHPGDPDVSNAAWMAACIQDVKTWIDDWNLQVEMLFAESSSPTGDPDLRSLLKHYGVFKQAEAVLLARYVTNSHGQLLVPNEDEIAACKQLIRAAHSLIQASMPSGGQLLFIFTFTWTRAHAVFTATITLMHHAQSGMLPDSETHEYIRLGIEMLAKHSSGNAGLLRYAERMYQLSSMSILQGVE